MSAPEPGRERPGPLRLRAASRSDVGKVRTHNEDGFLVTSTLCLVADGLGGHAGGEVASSTAIELVGAAFTADPTFKGLVRGYDVANTAILERPASELHLVGMATTLCALAAVEDGLLIVNVGDSRAYELVGGELIQVTHDDSVVHQAVLAGRLTAEAARVHPQRNLVTAALGFSREVSARAYHPDPDATRMLLCTDGLTEEVSDAQIAEILLAHVDPGAAADALVAAALDAGGSDNVTVVVADPEPVETT
ncbi:MAG: PP2C family protein-serine/threonine phosphatase [Frankiaceae bacterium]